MIKRYLVFAFVIIGAVVTASIVYGKQGRTDALGIVKELQQSAFDELVTSEPSPVVQVQFPYSTNTDIVEVRDNNGSTSVSSNMARLSTGAGANQSSNILTRVPIKYNPGQGGLARFTAIYDTGVADSVQWVGVGDQGDGYFFGYNGTAFSVLRRQGGRPETRRLTVSTGSTNAEDITITLNGNAKSNVTVTNSGNTTITANEIAAADFSDIGRGWEVHNMGSRVFFTSYSDDARSGAYSISGTSVTGSFSQSLTGITATETAVAQTAWNEDRFLYSTDGGHSPTEVTLDPTLGNVYQIRYQWLGFGAIEYSIEDPVTGEYVLVHRIEYANSTTTPSVDNPTLPLCAIAENTSNTSDVVLWIGSMGGFIEGRNTLKGIPKSYGTATASIGLTETPVITIHGHDIYQGTVNRVRVKPTVASVSVDGTKPAIVRVRKNPILVGAIFSALDADTSTIHRDFTANTVTGGEILFTESVAKAGSVDIDLEKLGIDLIAPDFLTLSIQATSGTTDAVSTFNWQELFAYPEDLIQRDMIWIQ